MMTYRRLARATGWADPTVGTLPHPWSRRWIGARQESENIRNLAQVEFYEYSSIILMSGGVTMAVDTSGDIFLEMLLSANVDMVVDVTGRLLVPPPIMVPGATPLGISSDSVGEPMPESVSAGKGLSKIQRVAFSGLSKIFRG